ncbi:MAG: hypothetical protein AAB365_02560 [Patescibacteria group bacterium]
MKIYVGCAIKGLAEAEWVKMKDRIFTLRTTLRDRGHDVLDFRSDANRQAQKGTVFTWDYKQCMDCDAMIAVTLSPSTGMGMEVAFCLTRRHPVTMKPNPAFVLAVAPRGNETTPMITECNLPRFAYREFDRWEDVPSIFEKSYIPK